MTLRSGAVSKDTPRRRAKVEETRRAGGTWADCARAAGVGLSTLELWRRQDPAWRADLDAIEVRGAATREEIGPDVTLYRRTLEAAALVGVEPDPDLPEQEQALDCARRHLLPFTVFTYDGDRPAFEVNWHHVVLANLLNQVAHGTLKRLMVSVPPGTGKSLLTSCALIGYIFGLRPSAKVLAGSYAADLAQRNSSLAKSLIDSPRYREVFPATALPTRAEQMAGSKVRQGCDWEISGGAKGAYHGASVRGAVTGRRAGWTILDDPIKNREVAENATAQLALYAEFVASWASRQQPPGCQVIVMTRWHSSDLVGRILEKEPKSKARWTVVNLPAILDGEPVPGDPRKLGDPIWPGYYRDPEEVPVPDDDECRRRALDFYEEQRSNSPYDWDALYQGRPGKREGERIKRAWLARRWTTKPDPQAPGDWLISGDLKGTASKEARSSFVELQVWYRPAGRAEHWIVDEERGRWGLLETLAALRRLVVRWPRAQRRLIEARALGPTLAALAARNTADLASRVGKDEARLYLDADRGGPITGIELVDAKGEKTARVEAVAPLLEASPSQVLLPPDSEGPWVEEFVVELCNFRGTRHEINDRADALTQALSWFIGHQPSAGPGYESVEKATPPLPRAESIGRLRRF